MDQATGKNGRVIRPGDLLLLAYGSGTQPARVREITKRGRLKIDRFVGSDPRACGWRAVNAPIASDDIRILGALPPFDPRRAFPGFVI
jgi:hypothetical protein